MLFIPHVQGCIVQSYYVLRNAAVYSPVQGYIVQSYYILRDVVYSPVQGCPVLLCLCGLLDDEDGVHSVQRAAAREAGRGPERQVQCVCAGRLK